MSGWTEEQIAALYREQARKQQMEDDGIDPAAPAEREAWEDEHPDTTSPEPPKQDRWGRIRLTDRKNSHLGGPATLDLTGTPDEPQLYASTPDSFSGIDLSPVREELIRFAREILAFAGEDYGVELPPWRPANNGTGKRIWFLCRYSGHDDQRVPLEDRYHYSSNGVLVRYSSFEAAQRAASKLNKAEQAAHNFTSEPNAVSGVTLTGDRMTHGTRRLTMAYPVSIGGARIEQRSLCVVLTDDDRRKLRDWLAGS
jgi:hypothetical protein